MRTVMKRRVSNSSRRLERRVQTVGFCALAGMALAAVSTLAGCAPASSPNKPVSSPDKHAAVTEPAGAGSPLRVRLITAEQYLNTLTSIVGPDFGTIETRFSPMTRTEGLLENGAAVALVNEGKMETFQLTATSVAAKIVDPRHRSVLIPCAPASDKAADAACASTFIAEIGPLLYRRPLDDDKLKQLVAAAGTAADKLKDFYAGLEVVLEGMLLSPQVLYVEERAEPDPKHPKGQRLDAYSLASRLSIFLWNSGPDEMLLNAAKNGEIETPQGRARIVDLMLKSPKLEAGVRAFFDDMLNFDDLAVLSKDPKIYPSFTGTAAADAREQSLRTIVDQLVRKKKDYRDLFTTRDTFISPTLAALYHVPVRAEWTPYQSPTNSPRLGLLTQISFLADHAHPGRSSPTLRGKALREVLLCQPVPRPPPNIDFSLIDNPSDTLHTAREKLTEHRKNPVCAGCHRITDPIGLALENFDGAGQYRETENGAPIDLSGNLDGKDFANAQELAQAVHDHPALPSCLVKRLYAYSTGGPLSEGDAGELAYLDGRFAAQGYRIPDLMRTIALSNAFSKIETGPAESQKTAAQPAKSAQ
jgi:hypothetical protein